MFNLFGQSKIGLVLFILALPLYVQSCNPAAPASVAASETETAEPEPVVVTAFTSKALLFMEYPRLVPGMEARFLAHVTVLATGEPVRSGQLRLEMSQAGTPSRVLEASKPARDGLFIPVGSFDQPGQFQARIVVESEQLNETIAFGDIVVYQDLAAALQAAAAEDDHAEDDSIPFLLEQQWKIGLRLHQVEQHSLTKRLQVPGEIEAPQNAMAIVSAPISGLLLPPPSGQLPQIGEWVKKGQILAQLKPSLSVADTAQLISNARYYDALELDLLLREFDLQAATLKAEQELLLGKTRLQFARKTLNRIEELSTQELATIADLESARQAVEVSESSIEGSLALSASIAQIAEQLNSLRELNTKNRRDSGQGAPMLYPLTAPIAGEVVAAGFVEGEQIEVQSPVYRQLDLSRVWISTHVSEFDLAEVGATPGALLRFAAYPERLFNVEDEMNGSLLHFGHIVDPATRTIEVLFVADNPDGLIREGMFADVMLETKHSVEAVAIPSESIVIDNGRSVAFVMHHGEAFEKRVLTLGIRDGDFVEVLDGIQVGDRVVTQGAYLVKLASVAPASFGEGHAH